MKELKILPELHNEQLQHQNHLRHRYMNRKACSIRHHHDLRVLLHPGFLHHLVLCLLSLHYFHFHLRRTQVRFLKYLM
jgi:hypothetical protein